MRKILEGSAYSLRYPIAHVVRFDGDLNESVEALIEQSFREAGIEDVIFELQEADF